MGDWFKGMLFYAFVRLRCLVPLYHLSFSIAGTESGLVDDKIWSLAIGHTNTKLAYL